MNNEVLEKLFSLLRGKRLLVWTFLHVLFLFAFTGCFVEAADESSFQRQIIGGLVGYPNPHISDNLLENHSFENILKLSGNPVGWTITKAFSSDSNIVKDGKFSFRMQDAPKHPFAESISQKLYLSAGSYRFGGWIKTSGLGEKNKGIRFSLRGVASTSLISGTNDWQYVAASNVSVPKDGYYVIAVEAYNEPEGMAWVDSVELRKESLPMEVFMTYPNYRGYLFDDQDQRVDLVIEQQNKNSVHIVVSVIYEKNMSSIMSQRVIPTDKSTKVTLRLPSVKLNEPMLVQAILKDTSSDKVIYEYPAYRIVKIRGSAKKDMAISFDSSARFLVRGVPTFFLGVYDSGMGYIASEARWVDLLTSQRRLFELPINLYINYWYGQASLESMMTMMNVLEKRGILYLHTGNCFANGYDKNYFKIDNDDDFLRRLSKHKGLAGFYTVDECVASLVPDMFAQSQRLKKNKHDGIIFGALMHPTSLIKWRDTLDVVSTDPYPILGLPKIGEYPFAMVGEWTRAAVESVEGSRPVVTVIQFFQGHSVNRWPTRDDLRKMSYMAITEGAQGLVYWSLGVRALAHVCKDWCPKKVERFEDLKAVMQEIKMLESVLVSIEKPSDIFINSSSSSIRYRLKKHGGKNYIFLYNSATKTEKIRFTTHQNIKSVRIIAGNGRLNTGEKYFEDKVDNQDYRVYEVIVE